MDSYGIAAAIATRLLATTPPTGKEAVKEATADLPESISWFPTVVVGLPEPEYITHSAGSTSMALTFPATLLLDRSDGSPRRARLAHDWLTALYPQLNGNLDLGRNDIVMAVITDWNAGTVSYGGDEYDGITFDVTVRIVETGGYVA
jgi:hypothetical protein